MSTLRRKSTAGGRTERTDPHGPNPDAYLTPGEAPVPLPGLLDEPTQMPPPLLGDIEDTLVRWRQTGGHYIMPLLTVGALGTGILIAAAVVVVLVIARHFFF